MPCIVHETEQERRDGCELIEVTDEQMEEEYTG
jgi:hypothetical protein